MSTKKESWKKLEAHVTLDDKTILRVHIERDGVLGGGARRGKSWLAADRMGALGAILASLGDSIVESAARRGKPPPPPEEPPPKPPTH